MPISWLIFSQPKFLTYKFPQTMELAMASIDALHAILDKAHEGMTPKQLMSLPPSALAGVTDSDAQKLKEAFGIDTIEELATCKYFLWAQQGNRAKHAFS